MTENINRLILLNQMAGPLFRELAEDLSPMYQSGCVLVTGHPDTLALENDYRRKLVISPAPGHNRSSKFQRVLSWLKYVLFISKSVLFAKTGDGILLVSNPPILGGWVFLLTRLNKVPYSVLVLDIHPEVYVRLGVLKENNILVKIWYYMNSVVYKNACGVVTIGERMAKLVKAQCSKNMPDVAVVPLWVDTNTIKPIPRSDNPYALHFLKATDKFVVLYSGNMGSSHDIESMLVAALILRKVTEIKFLFIGEGDKFRFVEEFVQKHQLDNVALFPFQPEAVIKYTLPLADVALVSLGHGMEDLMVPSKTFYYLAAGSAIVAIANDDSELSDLLAQRDCGVLVAPGDPSSLAEVLIKLESSRRDVDLMKKNARQLAEDRFSRQACINEFSRFLRKSKLL